MGGLVGMLSFVVFLLTSSGVDLRETAPRTTVGSCPPVEEADLGNTTSLSTVGLVPAAFRVADGSDAPMVQILRHKVVCEVAGRLKNTVGETSVLVEYKCLGPSCPGHDTNNPSMAVTVISQFQVQCRNTDMFLLSNSGQVLSSGASRVDNVDADFMTPIDRRCGACIDPATGPIGNANNDGITFCGGCVDCNEGQRRCIGNDAPGLCCNWYLNDECYITCPSPLIGDTETYDCGCGSLTVPPNGNVTYSERFRVSSIANHTCDAGYRPQDPSNTFRLCEMTGWNGSNFTCQKITCPTTDVIMTPENGHVSIGEVTFGSEVTYTCNDGFMLNGDSTRTCQADGTWSGDNPTCDPNPEPTGVSESSSGSSCGIGCIIGIIMAILGAIIIIAIIIAVAYGVYRYLNHPDTKLAKFDADKINGVARDNPLYVDPDAVVEDGAEAA